MAHHPLLLPVSGQDVDSAKLEHFHRALTRKPWVRKLDWSRPSVLSEQRQTLACWIASQASHAEQIGLMTAAILLLEAEDPVTRLTMATAVQDEAVHTQVFAAYAKLRGGQVEPPAEELDKTKEYLTDPSLPYADRLLVHALAEGFATDQFYYYSRLFADDLLGDIYRGVKSDEARHVRLGLDAMHANLSTHLSRRSFDVDSIAKRALYITGTDDTMYSWLSEVTGESAASIRSRYVTAHKKRIERVKRFLQ